MPLKHCYETELNWKFSNSYWRGGWAQRLKAPLAWSGIACVLLSFDRNGRNLGSWKHRNYSSERQRLQTLAHARVYSRRWCSRNTSCESHEITEVWVLWESTLYSWPLWTRNLKSPCWRGPAAIYQNESVLVEFNSQRNVDVREIDVTLGIVW
jgi:hypothetical protein